MNMSLEKVLLIVSTVMLVMFISAYSVTLIRLNSMRKVLAKEVLDNYALVQIIDQIKSKELSEAEIHNENFIKFISDSRDSAFKYIEDVQSGLAEFIDAVDDDINHFDQYGDVLSTNRPEYWSIKKISESYKKLKKLLPEDEENI